jgi:hypothetical protein
MIITGVVRIAVCSPSSRLHARCRPSRASVLLRKYADRSASFILNICPFDCSCRCIPGRILNLFSRDVYVLDQVLPRVMQGMSHSIALLILYPDDVYWSGLTRTLCVTLGIVFVVGIAIPAALVFFRM